MTNERYLFDNESGERRYAIEDDLPKIERRKSSRYSEQVEEQVQFAVQLIRAGVTAGVRDRLADKYGQFLQWEQVCKCCHETWRIALAWYE